MCKTPYSRETKNTFCRLGREGIGSTGLHPDQTFNFFPALGSALSRVTSRHHKLVLRLAENFFNRWESFNQDGSRELISSEDKISMLLLVAVCEK
ncbi:hypothetical protein AVEN_219643-1 [Araneus ventricosus]|uniref:Uncharacterized protein n=1 Tax=Araneus ventricosus TaxID=182803 RepID=A0A4Y2NWR4_ARAVE|nr:hypothetical protein AVEN_219643-1 [Araneus ventricosus]